MASFGYYSNWSYFPLTSDNLPLPLVPDSVSRNFSISIAPRWYDRAGLIWTIPSDWGSVVFNVYAAPTEKGVFTKLNQTPLASPQFTDVKIETYSKYESRWYVVEAVFPDTRTVQSVPTTWDNVGTGFVNLRIQEIQRREWLLLRKFVGVQTLLFRRKVYGKRCPECYNEDTKRLNKDHCLTCYGTSWEGGYYDPMSTLMQYDPTPNDLTLSYAGKMEPNQIQAWTIAYPEILDLDLIFRVPDRKVYRVDKMVTTELTTKLVRQTAILTEISKESIEHKLVYGYE
jgi:hypothetical protein